MNNNANEPINPIRGKMQGESDYKGLTKREYFAGLAMQGLLSQHTELAANGGSTEHFVGMQEDIAKEAVHLADALLLELEKQD